jgi:hypothetical protein
MTKQNQDEIDQFKKEIAELRARIAELERVINRTLPKGAQVGPDKPIKVVYLANER